MPHLNIHISPIRYVREHFFDDCKYVICSEWPHRELEESDNALVLKFADTEVPDHLRVFTKSMAEKIICFLTEYKGDVFICCDSGESRRAAIAAALMKADGQDERTVLESPEYHPNKLVYRTDRKSVV